MLTAGHRESLPPSSATDLAIATSTSTLAGTTLRWSFLMKMNFPAWRTILAVLLFPLTGFAVQPPTRAPLPNFDARNTASALPAAEASARGLAETALRTRVPAVKIEQPKGPGAPKFLSSDRGFLTGKAGEGGAVPAVRTKGFPKSDPHRGVKAFLEEHRGIFGHGAAALAAARLQRDETHQRLQTSVWQQQLDGIPIYEAIFKAHATVDGELVNVSSGFLPDPLAAAAKGTPNRPARLAAPVVKAADAVVIAAQTVGEDILATNVVASDAAVGAEKKQHFRAPKILDVSTEYVWLPLDEATLRLCWQVVLVAKSRGEMFKVIVDAETGEPLIRHGLTNHISNASYRVFTSDSPSPFSPSHPTPLTTQPPVVARTLVTTPALNTTASPNGWIDDGVNETRGNNVDAHLDIDANDVADLPRPQGSPNRVFDFPLDLAQPPSTYRDAAVTQLFYVCNWMHDKLYELGFTEASGNFQNNNFGRGGAGNDAVQADTQDGSGTDNADFSTPPDGSPGRMQMFVFSGPNPDRDGDFDIEIVLHEYTHGLSNRLVGGGIGIFQFQTAGMGEGWSDFYGLALLSEPGDDVHANYAAGGYATFQFAGLTTNYYSGIRRYPYSTDLTRNPLTFRDIDPAQANAHADIPRSPVIPTTANEVHNQGEVWCVTLWDARANLIARHGYAVGNPLILQLVTDGMKLAPANPNFLQARNAIIQADLVLTGGANKNELWAAFAKRGMGASATSPASSTTSGIVEAFDLPDDLTVTPLTPFLSKGPLGGPFLPAGQTYTLTNTNATTPVNWTATASQPWVTLSSLGGTLAPGASASVIATINNAANTLGMGSNTNPVTFTNPASGALLLRSVTVLAGMPEYFTELFDSAPNDTDNQSWLFTPNGSNNFYSVLRTPVTAFPTSPTGGTVLTLGDDDFEQVTPTGGAQVRLYGVNYSTFFVGSNGYITFGNGDTNLSEAFSTHFSLPRIAALFDDIDPRVLGSITSLQLPDRIAITFQNVPEYATTNTNSFQIEMFFDGRIRITCLGIDAQDGLIGLSRGLGVPADFEESDFSTYLSLLLTVAAPAAATEGDAPVTGTVSVPAAPVSNLVVNLASSDVTEATVPATVTILAGATSTTFPITILDDAVLDGTQNVEITATAPAYANVPGTIGVQDNETATLTLNVPAITSEDIGTIQGTVTVSAIPASAVTVLLTSNDVTTLQVPASVVIPQGQTSASFTITIIDDGKINGTHSAIIMGHVANWTDGSGSVAVEDNEDNSLFLNLGIQVVEGSSGSGEVQTSGTLPAALTISLNSSDPTHLAVPPTVTIPAGAFSATFNFTAPNNSLVEGTLPVTISASATGFSSTSGTVEVFDNDVHHFSFATVGSQIRGVPFSVSVTARGLNNAPITTYSGSPTLSASGGVSITPVTAGPFINGVWTGSVTANTFAVTTVLTVNDGAGHTGTSNAFGISVGPLHHFAWNPIGSPQSSSIPFATTITAQDAGNNTVTGFTGAANLSGINSDSNAGNIVITEVNPNTPDEIEFTNVGAAAVNISGWTVQIYDDVSWPSPLASFTIPAGSTCNAGQVFRLQDAGTAPGTFPLFFYGSEVNWTSAATSLVAVLVRDALGNLVDFVCAGAATPASITLPGVIPATQWTGGSVTAPTTPTFSYVRTGNSDTNSATNWTTAVPALGTLNAGLTLPFAGVAVPIAISPRVTLAFQNGTWAGPVTVLQGTAQMRLRADDGAGRSGDSVTFAVLSSPTLNLTPAAGFSASGNSGGLFTPLSTTFTVSNSGASPMNWTVTKTAPWLNLSTTGGMVAAGSSATVTVTINANANSLPVGTASDILTFTNTSNGVGTTTRAVALSVLAHPVLSVTPVGAFDFTGGIGGPFGPANATYTITNPGTGPLSWTAAKSAPWLTLSATSGIVEPGASTTVEASINDNANSLPLGTLFDTITFTNTDDGAGNTTRLIRLAVVLPAPLLAAEPAFTGGLSNTVTWSAIANATGYEVQRSTAPDFSGATNSGPVPGPGLSFGGLTDGTLYRYRVRAVQTPANPNGAWTQTTQADFDADTTSGVTATVDGTAILSATGGAPISGRITNPSFEGASLSGWTVTTSTAQMAVRSTNTAGFAPMPSQGTHYAGFNTFHNTVRTAGDFARLTQSVNLTGAGVLIFDALLDAPPGLTWGGNVRAEVRIDGVTVWSATAERAFLDRTVDVSGYTGVHTLELREEVIVTGSFNAQWVYFDNLRLATTGYAPSGTVTTPTFAPTPWQRWNTLTYTADTTALGSALKVDVLSANGTLLASQVTSGTDLNSLAAVAEQPAIKLRATLSTTNPASTPRLLDWTINYRALADVLGIWSNVESSTQDAQGPSVTIKSVVTTPNGFSGTATDPAGVAAVFVDGNLVSTNDGFAHWNFSTPLAPGFNAFTITAADGADPANTSSGGTFIYYALPGTDIDHDGLPDDWEANHGLNIFSDTGDHGALGDLDRDGIANLLELASGLDPSTPQFDGLPLVSVEPKPADGLPYLILRYRRLLVPGALVYSVEFSTNLQTWIPALAADFEQAASPTPTGDGLTETIALRIKPSLLAPGNSFRHVRVRVSAP